LSVIEFSFIRLCKGAHLTKPSLVALAVTLLAFTGCGGKDDPTAPTPTAAVFNVTQSPNPIIAGTGSQGFQYTAAFTISVTESAGVGGNVNFVNVTLRNVTTGVELNTVNFTATDVFNRAGTNHIAAKGTLNIPLSVIYSLALGGRQATMTIAVQIGDDAGHTTNQSFTVSVV
jgi:hypothetical protein